MYRRSREQIKIVQSQVRIDVKSLRSESSRKHMYAHKICAYTYINEYAPSTAALPPISVFILHIPLHGVLMASPPVSYTMPAQRINLGKKMIKQL